MAPTASRHALLWSLPTLAILLSFLWYKRKKSALRSDPGGTIVSPSESYMSCNKQTPEGHCSILVKVVECQKERDSVEQIESFEKESISEEQIETIDRNIFSESCMPNIENQSSISDNLMEVERCPELNMEKEIEKVVENSKDVEFIEANSILTNIDMSTVMEEEKLIKELINEEQTGEGSRLTNVDLVVDKISKVQSEPVGISSTQNTVSYIESEVPSQNVCSDAVLSTEEKGNESSFDISVVQCLEELHIKESISVGKEKQVKMEKKKAVIKDDSLVDSSSAAENTINTAGGDVVKRSSPVETVEGAAAMESKASKAYELGEGKDVSEEKQGAERDSANHSPAEVMLASPTMCSYSDAQSEGSSDSGKGCSYVATPPSRTPASGSSVSGDLPGASVFEFILPQHLVGRLIGRHGCFVNQIKATTHANILVKRHPDTPQIKICAVEGTQMDIESALEMIRQKFPLSKYPEVTLEQVSFLPPMTTPTTYPLMSDYLKMPLVESVNNDVILSSLISPAHFFLQQPTHPTFPALNQLNALMTYCYNEPNAPLVDEIKPDVVCAAPTMGGWFRAHVVHADNKTQTCTVRFVDYGGYLTLEYSALRMIRMDFMTLPFQAVECYLANVRPIDDTWSPEATAVMEELTKGQVLQAQVCGYTEDGVPVVYLYAIHGSRVVPISQELVVRRLAEWWEPSDALEAAVVSVSC